MPANLQLKSMDNRSQYIEPLIRLIELNEDKSWLHAFLNLKKGGYLPGGGAGSLNDWGPIYADNIRQAWYSHLYSILRYLYDGNLAVGQLKEISEIKTRNHIRVIRCLSCNNRYQHPAVFESYIALDFYHHHLASLLESKEWVNLFTPGQTFEHPETNALRDILIRKYDAENIKIVEFVNNGYQCPHCGKVRGETEHELYGVKKDASGSIVLIMFK